MSEHERPTGHDESDLATLEARLEEARFQLELSARVNRRLEKQLRTAEEKLGGVVAERDNLERRLQDQAAVTRIAARGFRIFRKLRDRVRGPAGDAHA